MSLDFSIHNFNTAADVDELASHLRAEFIDSAGELPESLDEDTIYLLKQDDGQQYTYYYKAAGETIKTGEISLPDTLEQAQVDEHGFKQQLVIQLIQQSLLANTQKAQRQQQQARLCLCDDATIPEVLEPGIIYIRQPKDDQDFRCDYLNEYGEKAEGKISYSAQKGTCNDLSVYFKNLKKAKGTFPFDLSESLHQAYFKIFSDWVLSSSPKSNISMVNIEAQRLATNTANRKYCTTGRQSPRLPDVINNILGILRIKHLSANLSQRPKEIKYNTREITADNYNFNSNQSVYITQDQGPLKEKEDKETGNVIYVVRRQEDRAVACEVPLVSGAQENCNLKHALALSNAFKFAAENVKSNKDGATGVACIVDGNMVYTANVGDSRAVLYTPKQSEHESSCTRLTWDQKPDDREECNRISNNHPGAQIYTGDNGGSSRVGVAYKNDLGLIMAKADARTGLAMTRSMGDGKADYKTGTNKFPGVIDKAEFAYTEVSADSFVILASDGLYDVMDEAEIKYFLDNFKQKTPENIAKGLQCMAYLKGSKDNITVAVVPVKANGEPSAKPVFAAVFDGHGGAKTSSFLAEHMPSYIQQQYQEQDYSEQETSQAGNSKVNNPTKHTSWPRRNADYIGAASGAALGLVTGAGFGAGIGFAVGSLVPVVGNALGAVIGSFAGAALGTVLGAIVGGIAGMFYRRRYLNDVKKTVGTVKDTGSEEAVSSGNTYSAVSQLVEDQGATFELHSQEHDNESSEEREQTALTHQQEAEGLHNDKLLTELFSQQSDSTNPSVYPVDPCDYYGDSDEPEEEYELKSPVC